MTTGELLKELRKQSGLSIREIVERSNGLLDKTAISRIEKGQRGVSFRSAYIFSRIYDVDIKVIAGKTFEGEMAFKDYPKNKNVEEQSLIEIFRLLPKDRKKILLNVALSIAEASEAGSREKARKKVSESLRSARRS
jgi:transcriptional regulator with XRE-family HTH domain